jgi:GMP synthase (glutamine-hydrolysing)
VKPILALQQVPVETLGTIGTVLADAGLDCRSIQLYREAPRHLELDQAGGLVVLGGPMNVDQTDQYPFLAAELEWIREAIERGLPVLGVCLGSQLMAKALGAEVTPNAVKEIGWYPIELTPEAADDRLFGREAGAAPVSRPTVFQWHGDTFELPPGAVSLARSEACENQAFRYGDRAYALQFHLEVTAEMIGLWLDEPGNRRELAEVEYIDPQAIREQTPQQLPAMHAYGQRVFGRFATMCA